MGWGQTKLATVLLATGLILQPSGDTRMFPERQHEPQSGKFDGDILILDGIGLLLCPLPGLITFGVDLGTGAIYLPEDVEKGDGPLCRDPGVRPVQ